MFAKGSYRNNSNVAKSDVDIVVACARRSSRNSRSRTTTKPAVGPPIRHTCIHSFKNDVGARARRKVREFGVTRGNKALMSMRPLSCRCRCRRVFELRRYRKQPTSAGQFPYDRAPDSMPTPAMRSITGRTSSTTTESRSPMPLATATVRRAPLSVCGRDGRPNASRRPGDTVVLDRMPGVEHAQRVLRQRPLP